jgi:protein-arginine kinase
MIEGQPAHIQARQGKECESEKRDSIRANTVREALATFPEVVSPTI